ncbi:SZT2 [Mytilus edulis]|uniref:SZT2 n=1 Tax=Mytilus edulis TaxID=6550 RepID=A0A8S3SCP6_MYTED|nr:SZT2 [Mytilus edulis]
MKSLFMYCSFFGNGPPSQYDNKQQEKTTPPNIHQMPFPFDLLSLLPKSQQAEILFSTYMLSSTDEQPSKGSNSILFQLLLDKLSETFDKKVSLSKTDCKRFLELLKKRSRDDLEYPLPFSIDKVLSNSTEIPQWCCFVKSVSNNRMFMTILPESFNDLLLLDTKLEVIKEGSSESDEIIDRVSESQSARTESPSAPTESPSESGDAQRDDGQQDNKPHKKTEHKHDKEEKPYHYYTIPFYMYESYLPNVLDMLINPWDFTLPEDIYEDLTFMESDRDESFSKSPMFKVPSFEREFTPGCDEATMYMSWMRINHERRLTECSNNENEATLKQQCSVLTDIYYSCFVNGVFQSVQQDLGVHKNDVDAAINNICEESLAIETDITTFLLSSCQHFQKIAESAKFDLANRDNTIQDEQEEEEVEDFFPRRQSVRFNDFVEELDCRPVNDNIPMSLQLPKTSAKLKTSLNYPCEFTEGSHNLVKNKFIDIVQKWFKQVPSNPDYYIYCPVNIPQSVSGEEESDGRNESDGILERKGTDHLSTASMLDSEESYTDEEICEEEKESENIPLFVFFTCTVKHRLDQEPIAVQGLIPCLDEIVNKIETDMEVNLSDLKVTFDINCVTMATDVEEEPKRTFMRMLSNNSTSSSPPLSPREDMMGSSTDLGSLKQTCPDPIKHLPRQQHLAVTKCKEELEWLLKDEIASSLRQLNLIQTDTLEFVTDHIKKSAKKGKPNCSCEHIPLHFVYGVEKSLPNFKEEFERLNLTKYKLMTEEDFYFVVTNKSYNNVLTKALTTALVELSRENTPASLEIATSSNDVNTAVTYVSPTLMSTEKQKIISPVSHSIEDGLSPLPSEKGGLSPLLSGSEESSSVFLKVDGNIDKKSDNDNNENSTASERDHFTDFYDKLEGIKTNIRPVKSVDLRSLSAGEIDLQGLKKSSSCAGIIMTSVGNTKEIACLAPPPPVMTWASHGQFLGRSRHFSAPSGQGTPRSKTSTIDHTPSWLSSRASEAGYEGDSSDNEEGDTGFNDLSGSVQQPIPKFWLIMKVISKVKDLGVDVYFHSRETGQEDTEEIIEQRNLVSHVKDSSEDGSEEEEEAAGDQHYLYDTHKWDGGHFDCESVYTKTFYIHSRLKSMSGPRTSSNSKGMTALKAVLNKFSVINRKNMFVIKESTTHAVFYLRLKEVSGKDAIYQRQLSTIIGEEFELGESSASLIAMMKREEMLNVPEKDSDTLSITSSGSAISSIKPQDEIQLFVHGIEPPGKDIRVGLVNTLQNKLDDAVLDILCLQLNRNPMSKLSAEDVHDIMDGRQQAIPDGQAFLYIRPTHGGKGIACISLALVDGKGIPVQALGCRKPSRIGYTKIASEKEFEHLIHTDLYESNGDSRPGPTALLQFRAWEVGSADLGSLKEKLILAVHHSLCDIVTEFTMLTASVCQIPHQLMELLPVASYSTPSSPHAPRESDLQRRHSIMTRKMPDKIVLSSAVSSPLLQSLKDAFTRVTSPSPDQAKSFFDIPSSAAHIQGQASPSSSLMSDYSSGSEGDVRQIIQKYEEGSRGILNPVFSSLLIKWFDFCHEIGVPSVSKDVMALSSRFAVDFFLKEFINVVSHILGDVHPKIFKLYKDSEGNLCNGTLYNPCRVPVQTDDVNIESSLDTTDRFDMVMADQDINFVVVGRNTEQWQASVQDFNEEEFTASPTSPKAIPKHALQRFAPLWSEREKSPDILNMLASPDPLFIPRQRLLLLTVQNRNLCLYTYNWAGDLNKMLILNNSELDNLIKHAAPPPNEHLRRKNSNIGQFSAGHPSQPFDEAFKDTQPTKPLSQTQHAVIRDVVKCHGLQTQGVRGHVRKVLLHSSMCLCSALHSSCSALHSSMCVTCVLHEVQFTQSPCALHSSMCLHAVLYTVQQEEDLHLLKQFSRLLHYCATPILFFSQWRQKIMEKYRSTQKLPRTPTPDKTDKSRSRHSSGTSTSSLRTKRADSQDGKKRPDSTPSDSPIHGQKQKRFQEEGWHVEIRSDFRHRKTPSHENFVPDDSHIHGSIGTVKHLQKTMSGGIMLMELSFREQYFCVKLFVCESSRLGTPVNQHDTQHQSFLKVLFVDECEKCKDLIHVHSFAHDFHLRSIQSCISGKGMYKNFYHMTGFLSDFSLVYPYPPAFSRNFLLTDFITFPELSSPAQTLYEHMTNHIKDHGMKVIAMTPTVDADIESEYCFVRTTEYALTQYKEFKVPTRQKSVTDDFDIGLVITNMSQSNVYQTDAERYTLKLQYFIVLTSKRDLFPVAYLEKKLGQFKTLPQTPEVIHRISNNPVPVKQHIGVRKQSRRPYKRTNQHQETAENILMQESTMAREKMNELIRQSTAECRKDSLWNRMLIVTHADEDVKKKKRSDTEESKDGFQKLSHDEFLELLGMVVKQKLSDIDPQLMPFHNMSFMWYKSLYKVLQSRYPETHRSFSSPDGHVQYLVVVNPQFPDMLMMLMIDVKDHKTDLCAVFREALSDESDQSKPSLPFINIQDHETDFINVCCFHLWASLL